MESEVTEIDPVTVEVQVEVPWEQVQKDLNDNFDRIAKTAKIRGFRPGKVPRKVVRQMFGRQVKGEVAANLVEQGLVSAIQEHDIHPVAKPDVDAPTIEDGQPWRFTAKVEIRPQVGEVDPSKVELYRTPAEVTDAQVDEELERMREQHAELRVPDPMRPAQAGDELTIDYTVALDGEPKDDMGATDRTVELGSDRLIPEFEEGLVGVQPGDEKQIDVSFPEDHGREDLQGKTATFRVKVKELRQKVLPELDDEFAKDVGDYETLLELRLDIRKRLEQTAAERADAELKEQAVDKLIEAHEVPVPPAMVQTQQQQMMYEFASLLQMSGQEAPMTEEMYESMRARAERRVRAVILLGALARQEGIDVGEEDVRNKLTQMAEQTGKHVAKLQAEYQGDKRSTLENQILEEKLMDFLLSRAQVKEGPPPEPAGGSEEGAPAQGAEEGEQE
ncbi:MAG: trigger factor [Myxococcota bacterium]